MLPCPMTWGTAGARRSAGLETIPAFRPLFKQLFAQCLFPVQSAQIITGLPRVRTRFCAEAAAILKAKSTHARAWAE